MQTKPISNIQQQVYEALKNDILYGVLEPGTQLKEMELAEHYQVSRSPIREALRRLCGDGLLELKHNCGIYVRIFTKEYVADILQMRLLLEGSGMKRLCSRAICPQDEQALNVLRKQVMQAIEKSESMTLSEHMHLDARVHHFFNSLNHNQVMSETWERILPVNVAVQRLSLKNTKRALQSQQEHLTIINFLLQGDFAAANEANRIHLVHTQEYIVQEME